MGDKVRFSDAAERLGISENTLRKRIREEGVTVYLNPRDKRERLLDWDELAARFELRPLGTDEGKAAA